MNWKRIAIWLAGIFVVLAVFIFVSGYAVLHSKSFHRYLLAKVVQEGHEATGGQVEVQNFVVHPGRLTATVYGIVIRGTEGAQQAPLLQVQELTIRLKILSVLHRKIGINEILIKHPAVHFVIDRKGRSNLPSPGAPKEKNSQVNLFDLAIGHVLLSDGEIYYNDRKTPLNADVHDLRTEVGFNSLATRYSGTLSYNNGNLQYGDTAPLPHTLNAQFSATPSRLDLKNLDLSVGSSHASLQASVTNLNNPQADGSYRILIHTEDFASVMKPASASGDLVLAGDLHYQSRPGAPLLQVVSLKGDLNSSELRLVSPQARLAVRQLRGKYQIANGNLVAQGIALDLLNGHLIADLTIKHLDTTPASQLRATVKGLSIDAAKQAARTASLQQMPLTGSVDGTAEAYWVGSVQKMKARSDISVRGAILSASGSKKAAPLSGAIHARYDGARNIISLQQTMLRIPSTTILADGMIGDHSNLKVQAHTTDMHDLVSLASALRAPSAGSSSTTISKPIDAHGAATLNALVQGSMKRPQISAQLLAQNLQVQGSAWRTLQANAQASSSAITIQKGLLVNARQGQVTFSASVGLQNWSYAQSNPIAISASVKQMPVAELQTLANVSYPVAGILSANVSLRGSQLNPVGSGNVELLRAKLYEQPFQNLVAQFQATGDLVKSSLNAKTAAGSADGNLLYYPKTRGYQLEFNAPGIVLQQLEPVKDRNMPVAGTLAAKASGSGTLDNPQLTATLEIPQLQLRQTAVTGVKAQLNVANHRADFALGSDLQHATLRAKATVDLHGNYDTVATLDTSRIPLEPLLAAYVSNLPNDAHAEVELHASLQGPLKDKSRLKGQLVIPTFSAAYQQLQIANAGPIRVDYANSVLVLQPGEIRGTDTSLRFQGRIPLQNTAAMTLTAQGSINLKLLRIFSPDLQSSGIVALNLGTSGVVAGRPQVQGQIRLQKVSIVTPEAPVGLENMDGVLTLANGQIHIDQLTGQSGGGQISVGGAITYQPQLQFNVALDAKSVRILYNGIRTVLEGNVTFTGTPKAAALNGRMLVDSLSFTPDFDLATFVSQSGTPSLPSANPTFADNINLNVGVQSSSDLSAVSSELSVEGTANLRIIGTAANPVIVGRTDLTSGEIFFLKQRYHLERGIINFINPTQTEPELNVLITTTIQQYNISLTIVGPVEKLRTSYVSDPPLPPVDIINLIARGQTTEQSAPGNFDANQVIAGELASQVSSRVAKLAGISSLTIDPLLGGNNGNPSARIALQQRVTRSFIFTFSTDVTNPQGEVIQGEYQLNKRWSMTATRDQYGGFAFDGKFHTTF